MQSSVIDLGRELLAATLPATTKAGVYKAFLENYRPAPDLYADDAYAWLACVLALQAVHTGNFGVGCVLFDREGKIVEYGYNHVFAPYFRSDLHAEMVVVNAFEDRYRNTGDMRGCRLYSSLEPCPMCTVRLITSRIDMIRYVAPDLQGGMARQKELLPEFWAELGNSKEFAPAACSIDLREAAQQIFMLNLDDLIARL